MEARANDANNVGGAKCAVASERRALGKHSTLSLDFNRTDGAKCLQQKQQNITKTRRNRVRKGVSSGKEGKASNMVVQGM